MFCKKSKFNFEIRTGSDSDISHIEDLINLLKDFSLKFSQRILSAHRTPHFMINEAKKLKNRGFFLSVAAAGGSAHLPGMTASETILPVIAIPIYTSLFGGIDSLLSSLQMPEGIPLGVSLIDDGISVFLYILKIINYLSDYSIFNNEEFLVLKNYIADRSKINKKVILIKEKLIDIYTLENKGKFFLKINKRKNNNKNNILIMIEDKCKLISEYYNKIYDQMDKFGEKNGYNLSYEVFEINKEEIMKSKEEKIKEIINNIIDKNPKLIIVFEYFDCNPISKLISDKVMYPLSCGFLSEKNKKLDFEILKSIFIKDEKDLFPLIFTGINRIENAFLFNLNLLGLKNKIIEKKIINLRKELKKAVYEKDKKIRKI